jgi:hypothetical protein
MTLTTETLLPTTVYGTPSGNYDGSSTAFIGNAIPAANFYGGQGSAQTAIIQVTGLLANIKIQGSLNDWTEQALWFDIDMYGNTSIPVTETTAVNMVGNFVWLRAAVTDFTAGAINSANVVY